MKIGRKYGEKEKIQILIKSLIFCTLQIYIFSFYAFLFFRSLADGLFRKILLSVSSDNTPYRYKNPLDKYSKRLHLVYIERQLYIFTLIEAGLFRY